MPFPALLVVVLLILLLLFFGRQHLTFRRNTYRAWITIAGLLVIMVLGYLIVTRGWSRS